MNLGCELKQPLKKWYAIYTTSRSEKKVADRLQDVGVDSYLPLLRVQRKWSDRVKIVEVPLFNSYVFINAPINFLHDVLKIDGVVKVLYFNGAPAEVREKDIRAMKEYTQLADNCELLMGDEVEIICGEMAKSGKIISGKIKKINKKYLTLYVEQLGATICVRLNQVKKIN